jgi:chaperone modulatory protein CbpM
MTDRMGAGLAPAEEALLTLDELCALGAVSVQWVQVRVEEGLLPARGDRPPAWRFDAVALARVRRMARMERHFDAAPELAALVADLEDEIERLRCRLRRVGLE